MNLEGFEGFEGCATISEVIYRYSVFKEVGIDSAVLDWGMYAYLTDYLADELWDRFRGVKYEG